MFSIPLSVFGENLNTKVYRLPNGDTHIEPHSDDWSYSYSAIIPNGEEVVIPTERLEVSEEISNQLRNSEGMDKALDEWEKQHTIIPVQVEEPKKESTKDKILSFFGF